MQDFNALEGKSLAELREIGRALGVGNVMLKKKELLEQIRAVTLVAGQHSDTEPVSYTHLDVYKRQHFFSETTRTSRSPLR